MPFYVSDFGQQRFEMRTGEVRVEALAQWFDEDEPVFKVRGLTYAELAQADSDFDRAKAVDNFSKAIGVDDAAVAAMKQAIGLDAKHPEAMVKRISFLVNGSIEPKVSESLAVQLSERFPVEFAAITNKILELTGLGKIPVKK